jgi:phage-related protein
MEYWTVEFYTNNQGTCYLENDLLNTLKNKNPLLHNHLMKKINSMTRKPIFRLKKSRDIKKIDNDVWELKFILPKNQHIRFLGPISHSAKPIPIFHVMCGFQKKSQKIPINQILLAQSRLLEFKQNLK